MNEARDNDIQILFGGIANYLEDTSNLQLVGNTLYVDGRLSYNVTNANEVIFQNNTYEMTLADVVKAIQEGADYGIWLSATATTTPLPCMWAPSWRRPTPSA